MIRGLKHFQFRGTDVIVFHVLDQDEIDFPFDRATRFEDLETDEEIMAVPGAVRDHYLREMDALIDRYRRELGGAGIDYQLLRAPNRMPLYEQGTDSRTSSTRALCRVPVEAIV